MYSNSQPAVHPEIKFEILNSKQQFDKGGMQAKGIWKQDPEANIWAQEGCEWGVEKASEWGNT